MALGLKKLKIGQKIGIYAVICGLLGITHFFGPLTLILGALQSKIITKPVSGDVVVVGIDSDSIRNVGRWPWPREKQAELLQAIDNVKPKAVFVDIGYQGVTNATSDARLRQTLEKMKSPVEVAALATETETGEIQTIFSHPEAIGNTKSVSVKFPYVFGYVWSLPYEVGTSRGPIKSFSASVAGINYKQAENYRIDLSYDPGTITVIPAKDVISGKFSPQELAGKKVVVGMVDPTQNDIHSMPGWGERPGVLIHVVGIESLKYAIPGAIGFLGFFGFAVILCVTLLTVFALRYYTWILLSGAGVILAVSTVLTMANIGNDPLPAIALLLSTGIYIKRQKSALVRSQRNSETGFSDMAGYFIKEVFSNAAFIAASIKIADTKRGLAQDEASPMIMKEVGRRLSAIIDERQLTHNPDGQFLWESPAMATASLGDHLDGLKQLFALPLIIDGRKVDIDIFFGVDRDVNENIATRSKRALDASKDAMKDQCTFKIATTWALENQLRINFREEFDAATANGDVAAVFQAQRSLATGAIHSAEVGLKWTHPAHGQIPTTLIVDMASKSGNLELISLLLCRTALKYRQKFEQQGISYGLSAKISTAALKTGNFHTQLIQMIKAENCSADGITLQIVDPEKAVYDETVLSTIRMLKSEGFAIAIGNFGKTNDDIDLIKAIGPQEIVLARSFSSELFGSTSNRIYVDAALRIAKAHNIITTAEDVEDRDILDELKRIGCDKAQGKIVDIPMTFNDFVAAHSREIGHKFG